MDDYDGWWVDGSDSPVESWGGNGYEKEPQGYIATRCGWGAGDGYGWGFGFKDGRGKGYPVTNYREDL